MATYTKLPLSASVYGKQILIASQTGSAPTYIHTAPDGETSLDEVWLYAYNDHPSLNLQLSVYWGGTTEPDDVSRSTVLYRTGRTLISDGRVLQGGLTISAYADSGSYIAIDGFINRVTF